MKCKYSVRCFSSKGAYLVLLWTLLLSFVICSFYYSMGRISPLSWRHTKWWISVPIAEVLIYAPLLGWLADAKYGNYEVFKFGAVLLFVSTVVNCLMLILELVVWDSNHVLNWIHLCLGGSLFMIGACACMTTALPLGLNQMPDASSSSIASYIAWFVSTIFAGLFLGRGAHIIIKHCTNETMQLNFNLMWALLMSICMSIAVSSIFAFSPKWLIVEPKSPQSLKYIYQVLRFTAKHKAPLNRSAFTYWEEKIPPRIDLGKTKYGGPFTTEQVEDVKTVLYLLAFTFSLFFAASAFFFTVDFYDEFFHYITYCKSNTIHLLMGDFFSFCCVWTLVHEFLVYPLFRNKFPSIQKRIGAAFLIMTFVCFICFVLKLALFLSFFNDITIEWIVTVLYFSGTGILGQVLLTSILEFMCAQSPYNMRGLLLSLVVQLILISCVLGTTIGQFLRKKTIQLTWCTVLLFSVKTVICLIGFLLFCVVARWYKMRVRDDDYSTQQVVEEVYDRYLTAAAAHTRSYGTVNNY